MISLSSSLFELEQLADGVAHDGPALFRSPRKRHASRTSRGKGALRDRNA
ncbi:hypothetical protein ACFU8Q_09010 [Streptomyces sp. NPDC057543]